MGASIARVWWGDRLKAFKQLIVMKPIYYITTSQELATAEETGLLTPPSFYEEGFIHCSFEHQTQAVLDKHFKDYTEVVILELDRTRLAAPVIEENLSGGTDLYPHIYGVLNLSAAQRRITLTKEEGGTFECNRLFSR